MRGAQKLRSAAEFERARKSRERRADALFVLQWVGNTRAQARIGMAVSARAVGGAVGRNRVRRLIRESFRLRRGQLPAVDVFVTARTAARAATNAEIFASLGRLWQEIPSSQ